MVKISQGTIDRIKQEAKLTDLMPLQKKGAIYISTYCPLQVNPELQIYKCFHCGATGDAIKFVMDTHGLSYQQALLHLADKYSIAIEYVTI